MLMQQLGLGQAAQVVQGSASSACAPAPVAAAARSAAVDAAGPLPAPPATASPSAAASSPASLEPTLLSQLACPITQEVMAEPVFAADGTTFERSRHPSWVLGLWGWVQGIVQRRQWPGLSEPA